METDTIAKRVYVGEEYGKSSGRSIAEEVD